MELADTYYAPNGTAAAPANPPTAAPQSISGGVSVSGNLATDHLPTIATLALLGLVLLLLHAEE